MAVINPYLTFEGNCEAAFLFYKSVFGGEFTYMGRFGEMPPMDGQSIAPDQAEKIMHVSLPIGNGSVMMGSDSSESFGNPKINMGNNFAISISADSREEADRLYNGLSAGGMQTMPMDDMFWGDYFGMFTDKFGINWMVGFAADPQK
jgi:PhnB protein